MSQQQYWFCSIKYHLNLRVLLVNRFVLSITYTMFTYIDKSRSVFVNRQQQAAGQHTSGLQQEPQATLSRLTAHSSKAVSCYVCLLQDKGYAVTVSGLSMMGTGDQTRHFVLNSIPIPLKKFLLIFEMGVS